MTGNHEALNLLHNLLEAHEATRLAIDFQHVADEILSRLLTADLDFALDIAVKIHTAARGNLGGLQIQPAPREGHTTPCPGMQHLGGAIGQAK